MGVTGGPECIHLLRALRDEGGGLERWMMSGTATLKGSSAVIKRMI